VLTEDFTNTELLSILAQPNT